MSVSAVPLISGYQPLHTIPTHKIIGDSRIPQIGRFYLYLNTSRSKYYSEKWKHDPWQVKDMLFVIKPDIDEIMLLRNRGGSKSRDGVELAIWFAYQKNAKGEYNRVIWYSASESQLETIRDYFKESRYVNKNGGSSERIKLWNGNTIKLRMMSEKQAVSPRSDILFFDEEQSMKKEIYRMALGTQVGSAADSSKKIHMGTTELDTVLHDNFIKLEPQGLVLEHHIDECSWTSVEKELRNYDGQPDFVVQSQLYCKWVRAGGTVFEKVEVRELTRDEINQIKPGVFYGVDPNPVAGHTLVKCQFVGDNKIYVSEELNSKDPLFLSEYEGLDDSVAFSYELQRRLVWDAVCEIEENAGEEFIKTFDRTIKNEYQGERYIMRWNDKNKHKRVYKLRKYIIIIAPWCKETISHVRGAVWNPKQSNPAQILKTPTQHYLDAFIHGAQTTSALSIKVY